MSSPFPGMDPYIEQSGYFRTFHGSLNFILLEQLNATLPPGYAAQMEERVIIEPLGGDIKPDVLIVRRPRPQPEVERGGTATLTPTPSHQYESLSALQRERFIEIRTGIGWREVVTVIEILSPTNKRVGKMRDEYQRKQQDILCSQTNLLEIDLLRSGAHTIAASMEEDRTRNNWHYVILSSPHWRRELFDFWPVIVRQPLPVISVPLRTPQEAAVMLDLQAAFNKVYAAGPYARLINYGQEPPAPPFFGPDVLWIDALLRNAGLRTPEDSERIADTENSEGSA